MSQTLPLQEILFSQGFGTRRICAGLIQKGCVCFLQPTADDRTLWITPLDPQTEVSIEGLQFKVSGTSCKPDMIWPYAKHAYIVLNKPAGYECSHKPSAWPSLYSLLPSALRQRPQKSAIQGVQAIGRLDQDTTGLLILTDDGALIHQLSSPKYHAPKIYLLTIKHPINANQIEQLLQGVVLNDSPRPVQAAACVVEGELGIAQQLRLTLTEGKYHQVKRMIAAVGNRVEGLHRTQIGDFKLPLDLPLGAWRWLTSQELEALGVRKGAHSTVRERP